jgi:hypothetical protein
MLHSILFDYGKLNGSAVCEMNKFGRANPVCCVFVI